MQVTMDMCSGSVDRDEYGTEVMCAGWTPEIRVMGEAVAHAAGHLAGPQLERAREAGRQMPVEVASMEIDAFLRKMYAAQE